MIQAMSESLHAVLGTPCFLTVRGAEPLASAFVIGQARHTKFRELRRLQLLDLRRCEAIAIGLGTSGEVDLRDGTWEKAGLFSIHVHEMVETELVDYRTGCQ